jgi:hypothetical protein
MSAVAPAIITRAQWGANPLVTPAARIATPSQELWIHHSGGEQFDAAGLRLLQAFALHRTDASYIDLEYTLLVDHVDCTIYESRGIGHDSAATYDHNTISHAICVMGNFQVDQPSDLLIRTLANLAAWGYEHGWWSICGFTGGHRDASGNSTACPGNNLEAAIPRINALAQAIHNGTGPTPPAPAPMVPNLAKGTTHDDGHGGTVETQLVTLTHRGFGLFDGAWKTGIAAPTLISAVLNGPAPKQDFHNSTDDWWLDSADMVIRAQIRFDYVVVTGKVPDGTPASAVPASVDVHVTVA